MEIIYNLSIDTDTFFLKIFDGYASLLIIKCWFEFESSCAREPSFCNM